MTNRYIGYGASCIGRSTEALGLFMSMLLGMRFLPVSHQKARLGVKR